MNNIFQVTDLEDLFIIRRGLAAQLSQLKETTLCRPSDFSPEVVVWWLDQTTRTERLFNSVLETIDQISETNEHQI